MDGAERHEDEMSGADGLAIGPDNQAEAQPAASGAQRSVAASHSSYRVQLDLFEGPLDLLLHLIKKSEVDAADIPIAKITEQYLGYLDLMGELNLEIAGEFLIMAATLTLIKSRMLLPSEDPDEEEEADPKAALIRQLLEYQRFREAAEALDERPRLNREVFVRCPGVGEVEPDADEPPRVRVTMWELLDAFRSVLKRVRPDAVHEVADESVTLAECADYMLRTLSVARSVTFDSLFGDEVGRMRILVTFLALLELMKVGAVEAIQEEGFGSIMIVLVVEDISTVSLGLVDDYGEAGSTLEDLDLRLGSSS